MSVIAINMVTTGSVDLLPNFIQIYTNDTLATVTAASYINNQTNIQYLVPGGIGAFNNQQMALVYTSDVLTTLLSVSVASNGAITLVTPSEGSGSFSSVTLGNGTAAAPSLNFASDTTTGLYRSASHVIGFAVNGAAAATLSATTLTMLGSIVAGASGTAGTIKSYPSAATSGSLALAAVANSGDFAVTISNTAYGQASTLSFADVGSAAGRFLVANTATPFTSGNLVKASGTGGLMVDAGIVAANVQLSTNIKAAQVTGLGGGGAGPLTVTAAGCTTSSIVNVTILASSNAAAVEKVVPGTGDFALTLTADPGATLTIQYTMLIAAQ